MIVVGIYALPMTERQQWKGERAQAEKEQRILIKIYCR